MSETSFNTFKTQIRSGVEEYLSFLFASQPDTEVNQVAKYAVLGGGHRWRAMVAVASGLIFDKQAYEKVLPGACGVELAHAASLIIDDLPSMDNAQIRRGKPCPHLVFSPWAVDLTPVYLVTLAYKISLSDLKGSNGQRVKAALALSEAGLAMIQGQTMDILQSTDVDPIQQVMKCYYQKSGVLYAMAAKAGAITCGASPEEAELLYECGLNLGLSYQLLDDIADATAEVQEVGKNTKMDMNKKTAITLFGIEEVKAKAEQYKQASLSAITHFGPEADLLRTLVKQASWAPS